VISLFNAVLSPVVEVTNGLVLDQNQAVLSTLKRKNELMERRAKERAYVRDQQQEDSLFNIAKKIGAVQDYIAGLPEVMESWLRMALNYILELLFFAAGLVINLIRTFYLIVLTLIGPLVIGFSVFPGFEGSLNSWIARYVQVYLWLPIANILGMIISRIQVLMVEQDLSRLLADGTYDGADMGYLLFLIMGIFSYLTIPSLAGFVIESSGAGRAVRELGQKGKTGAAMAGTGAGSVVGGLGGVSAPGYRGSMNTAENKGGVLSI
jgi:conjugative transposon TraJ protein